MALKGERRHHRQPEVKPASAPQPVARVEVPEWLDRERARSIFRKVVKDYLQRRIIRAPDFIVAGRWAHYLDLWIEAKEPNTGAGLERLLLIERALRPLEDRLGLSPLARQEIMRGLAAMPAAIGEMLADDKVQSGGGSSPVGETGDAASASSATQSHVSPLGFLRLVE